MDDENIENGSVKTCIVFDSKEDVTRFISKEYSEYFKDNALSERAIAKKIDVSPTFLNNLRNSAKKDISPDMAVKILQLIDKEEYIDPALKILSPVCGKLMKYADSLPNKEDVQFIDKKQYEELGKYFLSKIYGRLVSIIFTMPEVTIDKVNNISKYSKERLKDLKERNLIEIDGDIVRPSKKAKEIMSEKTGYIDDIGDAREQSKLYLSWMNPDMIKKNKEFGFIKNFLGLFYLEDLPELIAIYEEADRKAIALSERRRGGDVIVGGGSFLSFINENKKKEEQEKDLNNDKNSDKNPNKDLIL